MNRPMTIGSFDTLSVRITNRSHQPLPSYATAHSAGMDLRANLHNSNT
jgi:dUTP pyrophosphatase